MATPMAPRIRSRLLSRLSQSRSVATAPRVVPHFPLRQQDHEQQQQQQQTVCRARTISTTPRRWQDLRPPEPSPSRPRRGRRLLFAATFLLIGTAVGSSLRVVISPPSPPDPDTEEDEYTRSVLRAQASRLAVVRELEADPAWESWDAYNTLSAAHRAQHITAGALRGSRGVGGYQRIFYRPSTGDFVSVVYFGAATTGWPGVVHGGALATVLDESCGRAAFKQWGGRSGVTAYLKVEYKKISLANGFYVLRVRPRPDEDLPPQERGKRHYKCFVDATVEDAASGRVTVQAEALFVGGRGSGKRETKGGPGGLWGRLGKTGQDENQQF